MADDVVKDNVGKVQSKFGTTIPADTGVTWKIDGRKNQVTLLSGTTAADRITGTDGDDIITLNGTQNANGSKTEWVNAGRGNDTVILPGNQADWVAKLPNVADYASKTNQDFWKDSPQQAYGRVLVLENVVDHTRVVLSDVETVVFADKKLKHEIGRHSPEIDQVQLIPEGVRELDAALKKGTVKSVSTKDMFAAAEKGETPAEILSARIQSTQAAQEKLSKGGHGSNPDFDKIGDKIAQDLMKSGAADYLKKIKEAPIQQPLAALTVEAPQVQMAQGPVLTFKI